jgi:hypothetical protein
MAEALEVMVARRPKVSFTNPGNYGLLLVDFFTNVTQSMSIVYENIYATLLY